MILSVPVRRLCFSLMLLVAVSVSTFGWAQPDDPNCLTLKGGFELRLPDLPTDTEQLAQFNQLSPSEQQTFYYKRRFLISFLAAGVAKPGLRRGFRWLKDKIYVAGSALRERFSVAQVEVGEAQEAEAEAEAGAGADVAPVELQPIEWMSVPANMSASTQIYVEGVISSLVDQMWRNSVYIARAKGMGLTVVVGAVLNNNLFRWGYMVHRAVAVHLGVDFESQAGYLMFESEKQSLRTRGFSVDVGLLFNYLVHVRSPGSEPSPEFVPVHNKYTMLRCFRNAGNYRAWGVQSVYSVASLFGTWLLFNGYPVTSANMMLAMRLVSLPNHYSTNLQTGEISSYTISNSWLRRLGLSRFLNFAHEMSAVEKKSCAQALTAGEVENSPSGISPKFE